MLAVRERERRDKHKLMHVLHKYISFNRFKPTVDVLAYSFKQTIKIIQLRLHNNQPNRQPL